MANDRGSECARKTQSLQVKAAEGMDIRVVMQELLLGLLQVKCASFECMLSKFRDQLMILPDLLPSCREFPPPKSTTRPHEKPKRDN